MKEEVLKPFYLEFVSLWKSLCEMHTTLLELTFDEYSFLLASDIESLEKKIEEKSRILSSIDTIEKKRTVLLNKINSKLGNNVTSIKDLLSLMRDLEEKSNDRHLLRLNSLLIDIIEKIQEQNKRNKLFINKAILSLNEIRTTADTKKKFETYTPSGSTKVIKET